ncbi:tetratricopeptide repeat protein [Pseudidiomarina sp.]|uniref:tetratricopeptide repeat protein n=1 Tax=Pseudidiomarina sp. TaxID=2081707 RepID=UPI00299CF91E|nr:tetratricopeptide repeat protein [Pseudidiomarina sp.]MDX1706261.1 tetratricopeptide repeat protein [Pseudidiomarina sp.]
MVKAIWLLLALAVAGCTATGKSVYKPATERSMKAAETAYRQGDLHLAEGLLLELVKDGDNSAPGWCYLGHISFRQHRYEEALAAYQRCLEFRQQQPDIWRNMAALRLRQATELLLSGTAYLAAGEVSTEQQRFNREYHKLLQQLMVLQQVDTTLLKRPGHGAE